VTFISECTLCGKKVEKLFLVEVEGSKIEVCESCKKYGEFLGEIKSPKKAIVKKEVKLRSDEVEEILKPNYGQLIIQTRQKMGLKRKEFAMKINEKESVIRRVESQKMEPDDRLRKKIENFLGIKLTEVYEGKILDSKSTQTTLTLGDVIEVK